MAPKDASKASTAPKCFKTVSSTEAGKQENGKNRKTISIWNSKAVVSARDKAARPADLQRRPWGDLQEDSYRSSDGFRSSYCTFELASPFLAKRRRFLDFNCLYRPEKLFRLDGPDVLCQYWHDLRRELRLFSKRHNGGASVMVWAGIGFYGVTPIVLLEGRQDSSLYCQTFQQALLPYASETFAEQIIWRLQQDNSSIQNSQGTRSLLSEHSIITLPWPARSPDLNNIEKMGGILVRIVYAHGRQLTDAPWATIEDTIVF